MALSNKDITNCIYCGSTKVVKLGNNRLIPTCKEHKEKYYEDKKQMENEKSKLHSRKKSAENKKCKYCGEHTVKFHIYKKGNISNICEKCYEEHCIKHCEYCGTKENLIVKTTGQILPVCQEHKQLYYKKHNEKYKEQASKHRKLHKHDHKKCKYCGTTENLYKYESGMVLNCCIKHYEIYKKDKINTNKQTCIDTYGVDNVSKVPEIHEKKKITSRKNYGTDYSLEFMAMQNEFSLNSKNAYKSKFYKNTNLKYQTMPELKFIEKCKADNIEIQNGNRIQYYFKGAYHYYFCDFKIKDKDTGKWQLIEIKGRHKWYYKELISGKLLAKAKAAIVFSTLNNYLPYRIIFS